MRWLRQRIRAAERAGGDWRDVVDGLRPFNQTIWQSWPASAKRRFLDHTKAWWDIHRHRMPPQLHRRVSDEIAAGQLTLVAGRIVDVEQTAHDRLQVLLRRRGQHDIDVLEVSRIIDCTGIIRDASSGSIAVLRDLIDRGAARVDPLKLGIDVTPACAIRDADGAVSERLYAVGPLTRGTFFEIDAVPDIRCSVPR